MQSLLSNIKTTLYRLPKSELERLLRWGPVDYLNYGKWQRKMESQASKLPPLTLDKIHKPLEVWSLTGSLFWYQTLFCIYSLSTVSGRSVILHLLDDGSLTTDHIKAIRSFFPLGTVRSSEESHALLEDQLPPHRYKSIHRRWESLMVFRKLTDVHLGNKGFRVFLDSDMLFWRYPQTFLDWYDRWINCQEPRGITSCFMTDCIESYGYPVEELNLLSGYPVPRLINTGVNGVSSTTIDWDEIEYWIAHLENKYGTSYFLEQSLFAMIGSREEVFQLPPDTYIVSPNKKSALCNSCDLQHYVYDSKPRYFGNAWKEWMKLWLSSREAA